MDEVGRVETNTDEIFDPHPHARKGRTACRVTAGGNPEVAAKARAVLLHDTDRVERLTPITVLPGVRILVDDNFTASIVKWVEFGGPEEFFAWNARNRD